MLSSSFQPKVLDTALALQRVQESIGRHTYVPVREDTVAVVDRVRGRMLWRPTEWLGSQPGLEAGAFPLATGVLCVVCFDFYFLCFFFNLGNQPPASHADALST